MQKIRTIRYLVIYLMVLMNAVCPMVFTCLSLKYLIKLKLSLVLTFLIQFSI